MQTIWVEVQFVWSIMEEKKKKKKEGSFLGISSSIGVEERFW